MIYVNEFTDGILNPNEEMRYRVKDGGLILANTAPGCWGPMITPKLKGGHEVTKPVFVEGAEVGDAIAIHIQSIKVTSIATASGNDKTVEGHFLGDPFVAAKCPECGEMNPDTEIKGIGKDAIHCKNCEAVITPFVFTNGYTMVFDDNKTVGITLDKSGSEKVAKDGHHYMEIPENSIQNPIVSLAPSDIVGMVARMRPFLGQLGTTPARPFPDSHNAGDFGQFLIDAPHDYALTAEELEDRTDGHMDISRAREGAIVICPVKVAGGGVYLGDMHAMQGDSEIAGHTTDVSGVVQLKVDVLKNVKIDGPIILPVEEDLPHLAKPFSEEEKKDAKRLASQWGVKELEEALPLQFVGTGANLNDATENGMKRASDLLGISLPEVMNRVTVNGNIEVGRHPGVVTVTFLVPNNLLKGAGILEMVEEHYS